MIGHGMDKRKNGGGEILKEEVYMNDLEVKRGSERRSLKMKVCQWFSRQVGGEVLKGDGGRDPEYLKSVSDHQWDIRPATGAM